MPTDEPPSAAEPPPRPAGGLSGRLHQVERLTEPGVRFVANAERSVFEPAWRRVTDGEPRWQVSLVILLAVGLQLSLPSSVAPRPRLLLPALEVVLLVVLVVANPGRIIAGASWLRRVSMGLIAVISVANGVSAGRLVWGLIHGTQDAAAGPLLATGGSIWLTNVIVFALWYWELDRGGPVARAHAIRVHPDFLFPQMQSPDLAPDWEAAFVDYLYLSFTNATAFSPTDVLPFSRWAKLMMMGQSAVSLVTVALVVARAVNILK